MSPIKTALLASLAAAVATSGWQYHDRQSRAQEAAHLRSANDQLRLQANQQHEAQAKHALTKGATAEGIGPSSSPVSRSSAETIASLPTKNVPATSTSNYRNEGQSTPVNTLQTFAWACDQGDAALMEKLLIFDATAREKVMKYLAANPSAMPPQFPSIEAMSAAIYISDGIKHPYPVAEILQVANFEPVSPTRMILHLPTANGDGYEFQNTPDGWKVAITDAVVENYIKESSSHPTQP